MSNLVQVGLSPSSRLREAWVALLNDIGVPVYDTLVPESDNTPNLYVIIHDFTKLMNESCKDEIGWDCTVLVDICHFQAQGYFSHDEVDTIEQTILNKVKLLNEFVVEDFDTEKTIFINSRSQDVIQPPQLGTGRNMARTILTYEHTLYETMLNIGFDYAFDFPLA